MKNKYYLLLSLVAGFCNLSKAQDINSNSVQPTTLDMAEVVSATLFPPGSTGSATVDLPIGGTSALADGIESPEIKVTLQSTTDFDISVSASSENFSYSGPSNSNTLMQVKDVLSIIITENNTGGSVGNGLTQYQPIDGIQGKLAISSGLRGVRTFAFKYKAQPGFNSPAGTYTTDIVYTISKK